MRRSETAHRWRESDCSATSAFLVSAFESAAVGIGLVEAVVLGIAVRSLRSGAMDCVILTVESDRVLGFLVPMTARCEIAQRTGGRRGSEVIKQSGLFKIGLNRSASLSNHSML
jgi:hypothetical protein